MCRFFLLFLKVKKFFFSEKSNNDTSQNILIIKFFGLGSILLAAPAIEVLKASNKNIKITFLTTESNTEICSMLPCIDEVITININTPLAFIKTFLNSLMRIKSDKIDTVIDLEFLTNFSALTTLLVKIIAKVNKSVGFNSPLRFRNSIYDYNISFDHSRHITKIFFKVVHPLIGDLIAENISFKSTRMAMLNKANYSMYNSIIDQRKDLNNYKIVTVNINAGILDHNRRWPKEYYLELITKVLSEKKDIFIVLIGGKSDILYVEELHNKFKEGKNRIFNMCGRTLLSELFGILDKSILLITNDSGPLHIGYILDTPTVALFGPETPSLYGPEGENHHVFYEDLYCSPCLNIYNSKSSHCKDNVCMKRILPQDVFEVINKKYL